MCKSEEAISEQKISQVMSQTKIQEVIGYNHF